MNVYRVKEREIIAMFITCLLASFSLFDDGWIVDENDQCWFLGLWLMDGFY